jgi:hypothetical protein
MKTVQFCACLTAMSLWGLIPSSTAAQIEGKQRPARSIEVSKVFGYYDVYLRLPAQGRDGFRMVYSLNTRQTGVRPQLNYALGSVRTPIEVAPSGKILTMPDATMFQNGKVEIPAGQPSASINLDLEAVIPLSRTISVADATNPISDYTAALRSAGPLGMLAPKFKGIIFRGGTGGEVIFGNGRRLTLPITPRGVLFQPSAPNMRGAVTISFVSSPTSAEFSR